MTNMRVVLWGRRVYALTMPELLGLAELKKRAKAAGYTKIKRLADAGSAVPLDGWNGVTAEAGIGFVHVGASYILNGNTVIVRKMGEAGIYYGLS
jgi:hypothetical protein